MELEEAELKMLSLVGNDHNTEDKGMMEADQAQMIWTCVEEG